jgi:tetratricopeptide (TPR) repeat protein
MTLGLFDLVTESAMHLRMLHHTENAAVIEAESAFCRGEYQEAEAKLRELGSSTDAEWTSRSFLLRTCFLAERGRYREAMSLIRDGIEFDISHGRTTARSQKLLTRAHLLYRVGRRPECRRACLDALKLERGRRSVLRGATLLARSGYASEAQDASDMLDPALKGPIFEIARLRARGEILLAQNRAGEALPEMRIADRLMPKAENREFLARTLAIAGYKQEAEAVYRLIARAPASIWNAPDLEPPGTWADAVFQHARIAFEMRVYGEAQSSLMQYTRVRQPADPDFSESIEARRLLDQMVPPPKL